MRSSTAALVLSLIVAVTLVSCDMQQGTFDVVFERPAGTAHTNGTVPLEVRVTGGAFDRIEFLHGDTVIGAVTGSTRYEWDTTEMEEGTYAIHARAVRGDQSAETQARDVEVDRTAPSVVGTTPADGDTNVESGEEITVTFSEPVDPESITSSSLPLATATSRVVPAQRTVARDGTSVTVSILGEPELPVGLVASASNQITDRAGNPLDQPTEWSWVVPAWYQVGGLPFAVDATNRRSDPDMALGPNGDLYVAFREYAFSDYRIYVSVWDGASWQPVGGTVSSTSNGFNADTPSLAVDSTGRPVVAYEVNQDIVVKRFESGTWAQLGGNLDIDAANDAVDPDLALDSNDNPVVTWSEFDSAAGYDRVYVRHWNGSSFDQLGPALNVVANDAENPSLAVWDNDDIAVAWDEFDGSDHDVYHAEWDDYYNEWEGRPGDWSGTPEPLDRQLGANSFDPSIAARSVGTRPYVTWEEGNDIYVALPSPSFTYFVGDGPLNVNDSRGVRNLEIAVDDDDRPVVAWNEYGVSSDNDIYVKRFEDRFVELGGPVYEGPHSASAPSLIIGPDGEPYVAYSAYTDGVDASAVHVVRYNGL